GGNLLQRGGVDDIVYAVQGASQACLVAHVTQEPAHARVGDLLRQLELLQLVARVHDDAPYTAFQGIFHEMSAERPRTPSHQDHGVPQSLSTQGKTPPGFTLTSYEHVRMPVHARTRNWLFWGPIATGKATKVLLATSTPGRRQGQREIDHQFGHRLAAEASL